MSITFGSYLKKLRKNTSTSAVSIAKKLEVTTAYISRIETGAATPPGHDVCLTISQVLNLDDIQQKTLFSLALKGRVASTNADFLRVIGDPIYANIDCAKIPIIDLPGDHLVFPLPESQIQTYTYTSELPPSPYLFAITNQYLSFPKLTVSKPDILIFEAYNNYLSTRDLVLVKIGDTYGIKQMTYMNQQSLIKFSPAQDQAIFDTGSDSYTIAAKLIYVCKQG